MTNNIKNPKNNPFINLIFLVDSQDNLNRESQNLFISLINSNLSQLYNINEVFNFDIYNEKQKNNLFPLLVNKYYYKYTKFTDIEKNFFKQLFASGLEILPDQITNKHPIYSHMDLDENFLLFNLEHLKSIDPYYNENIKKYNVFHNAVKNNKFNIINFLMTEPTLLNYINEDKETPLMSAKTYEMMIFLDKLGSDWSYINSKGDSILSKFSMIEDNSIRTKMMNYAKKKTPNNASSTLDKVLLNLVINNNTKKEISEFITKNNLTKFYHIKDEQNNNLAMISLNNNSLSKLDIFIKNVDLNQSNLKKENILFLLLTLDDIKINELNSAKDKLSFVVDNISDKKLIQDTFKKLIQHYARNRHNKFPYWLLEENQNTIIKLAGLDNQHFDNIKFTNNHKKSIRSNDLEYIIDLLMKGFVNNGGTKFDISYLIKETMDINYSNMLYSDVFDIIPKTIYCLDKNNIDFNRDITIEKISKDIISFLNKNFEKYISKSVVSREASSNLYVSSHIFLIEFMINNNYYKFVETLEPNILNHPKLEHFVQYAKLNNNLLNSKKQNFIRKI